MLLKLISLRSLILCNHYSAHATLTSSTTLSLSLFANSSPLNELTSSCSYCVSLCKNSVRSRQLGIYNILCLAQILLLFLLLFCCYFTALCSALLANIVNLVTFMGATVLCAAPFCVSMLLLQAGQYKYIFCAQQCFASIYMRVLDNNSPSNSTDTTPNNIVGCSARCYA